MLDVLTVQFDLLSKPVDPSFFVLKKLRVQMYNFLLEYLYSNTIVKAKIIPLFRLYSV